jgi:hypothetical protein
MGLVQMSLTKCWTTDPIYNFPFPRIIMFRNRFELLLANLHFENNEHIKPNNRLGKILPLVYIIINSSQKVFSPGPDIAVD